MSRPRVFLDVSIAQEHAGRLGIELFTDKTPRTAENFRQLCAGEHDGLSYVKVPFHRIIDEFMVQGGDIQKHDGSGIVSIYDGPFEDENLEWRHLDAAGLVCSANRGKDTNGSQFFITLEPCPHLNGKHTIFGRLVAGQEVLSRIAKVAVDRNDRPLDPVLISRCGELERKKKDIKRDDRSPVDSLSIRRDDRGRRRASNQEGSDENLDAERSPDRQRRRRRQSDNVVDEGIRGRPRARSNTRSPSNPLTEEDEDRPDTSPVKKHKRKRSPSPSRHVDQHSDEAGNERRRRSLPNQYPESNQRDRYEEDRYRPSPRRDGHRHLGRRRADDRYRPLRTHHSNEGRLDDGRLSSGGGSLDETAPPVRYRGRGVMKYREPDRAW